MAKTTDNLLKLPHGISLTRLRRTVRLGMRSLWLHRLRSLLTVLGIVFGVCSVIAMLAIGEGASFEAQEQIKNLGSQNIIVRSVAKDTSAMCHRSVISPTTYFTTCVERRLT